MGTSSRNGRYWIAVALATVIGAVSGVLYGRYSVDALSRENRARVRAALESPSTRAAPAEVIVSVCWSTYRL